MMAMSTVYALITILGTETNVIDYWEQEREGYKKKEESVDMNLDSCSFLDLHRFSLNMELSNKSCISILIYLLFYYLYRLLDCLLGLENR